MLKLIGNLLQNRRALIGLVAFVCTIAFANLWFTKSISEKELTPLEVKAYCWKRQWTPSFRQNMQSSRDLFGNYSILMAEISYRQNHLQFQPVHFGGNIPPYIKSLSFRINKLPFTFSQSAKKRSEIIHFINAAINEAQKQKIALEEIQIDYDCPTSKLLDYAQFIAVVQKSLPRIKIAITALPSWMNSPNFSKLTRTCDAFILQVHALQLPRNSDVIPPLFELEKAKKWTKKANSFNREFHIALPAYGHWLGFNKKGKYLGVAAEQGPKSWPIIKAHFPSTKAIANYMEGIQQSRPPNLKGIFWYRLADKGDKLVWQTKAIKQLMNGRDPAAEALVEVHQKEPGLCEILFVNKGSTPLIPAALYNIETDSEILFAEALQHYNMTLTGSRSFTIHAKASDLIIPPHSKTAIAWIRLHDQKKTRITIH